MTLFLLSLKSTKRTKLNLKPTLIDTAFLILKHCTESIRYYFFLILTLRVNFKQEIFSLRMSDRINMKFKKVDGSTHCTLL